VNGEVVEYWLRWKGIKDKLEEAGKQADAMFAFFMLF